MALGSVGVGLSNPLIVLHTSEPLDVIQKDGQRPAVSEAQPTTWRPNAIKPDQLLSNASGPLSFLSWQGAEATAADARCGDVG